MAAVSGSGVAPTDSSCTSHTPSINVAGMFRIKQRLQEQDGWT